MDAKLFILAQLALLLIVDECVPVRAAIEGRDNDVPAEKELSDKELERLNKENTELLQTIILGGKPGKQLRA